MFSHQRRRTGGPDLLESWKASVVGCDLSPRSRQTLRRLDLEELYDRNAAEAAARLHAVALRDLQPDFLFALAEMSYLHGRKIEKWNCSEAVIHYYMCAGYAYHFLFATADTSGRPPAAGLAALAPADAFDPRFRLACDLYNAGLSKCITAAQRVGHLDPRKSLCSPRATVRSSACR